MFKIEFWKSSVVALSVALTLLLGTAAAAFNVGTLNAGSDIRVVALSGQSASGLSPQIVFQRFGAPTIDDFGDVAFHGVVQGPGIAVLPPGFPTFNDEGLWYERPSGLTLAAREFDFAPSPNAGQQFRGFDSPIWDQAGNVAFRGYLSAVLDVQGVWTTSPSGLHQITGSAFPVPDANGNPLLGYFWNNVAVISATGGKLLLTGQGIHPSDGKYVDGFWLVDNNSIRLVVQKQIGVQAPGANPGTSFAVFGTPSLNGFGHITFEAEVSDDMGFGPAGNSALWTTRNGTLEVLAHVGSPATEFGSGRTYARFTLQRPSINNSDAVVFHAYVQGTGISSTNDEGIVVDDGTGRRVIALEGQPAPGTSAGSIFGRMDLGSSVVNGRGQVAFSAMASGQNGIWLEDSPADLRAIAIAGDLVPGGGRIGLARSQPFVLNERGQVAFGASSRDSDGNVADGIWATDRFGVLQLVAQSGDRIELQSGDIRTISGLRLLQQDFSDVSTGLQDGGSSSFNDDGELAFTAQFTDNTWGVFVSRAVAIPEPSSAVLGSLGLIGILCRRRWRNSGATARRENAENESSGFAMLLSHQATSRFGEKYRGSGKQC